MKRGSVELVLVGDVMLGRWVLSAVGKEPCLRCEKRGIFVLSGSPLRCFHRPRFVDDALTFNPNWKDTMWGDFPDLIESKPQVYPPPMHVLAHCRMF